jgi:hypothetical protein
MVRGKTRGTHSISNLLFSLFKIGLLPATQNSGGCGGDMGGRSSRAGREEVWSDVDSKQEEEKKVGYLSSFLSFETPFIFHFEFNSMFRFIFLNVKTQP